MSSSMVWTSVDLDGEGKHFDYLRVPHSIDTSAYGFVPVPVVRIRGSEGPTIILSAGNHGDEYEGQVALIRLAQEIDAKDVNGRLIILPGLNFPAVAAGRRNSPLDEGNLNRAFPGRATGTPTQMIAHFLTEELLPRADLVIDLHSGGRSLQYMHCALGHYGLSPEIDAKIRDLLSVFGAPWSVLTQGGGGGGATTFYATAAARGIPAITTELGGGATLSSSGLRIAEEGVRRVLAHFGIWQKAGSYETAATQFARVLPRTVSIYAPHSGLFEPLASPGDSVSAGQRAGLLYSYEQPMDPPTELFFSVDGVVSCCRALTHTQRGDCLYNLATPI